MSQQNICFGFVGKLLKKNRKKQGLQELLGWREYKYTFIVLHRMNLPFDVSIQEGVFGVPVNYHTFTAINYRFKVLAYSVKNDHSFIAINYRLKSTCLNSQYD